ncbi:DUF6641 family protein [Dechloromonas sp. ZS-1]|uniref:DUF6641 family protein n=1 Tax=Dechloromonas sp. ZS-1 TaxID=3138067 RepID=UPI0031FE2A5F
MDNQMAILSNLKLVSAQRNTHSSPVIQRRNKLLKQLFQQINLAKAQESGECYAPTYLKKVTNSVTGETATIQATKQVKQWWSYSDNGKINLFIRYGAKILTLGKNTNAIELSDKSKLVETLELIKQAVEAGEMDAAIETVSQATRKQFK